MTQSGSVMIATVGGQPQVVTFALDDLLQRGAAIREVIVVHLAAHARSHQTGPALARLTEEFQGGRYPGLRWQFFPVRSGEDRVEDIADEAAAHAAWSTMYRLIADLKNQNQCLEVCIAGGRRLLALLTMSAAMLHFDHHDRLWHLYTPTEFLERARDGAIMHARPEDGVRLIQVPLVPWGAYFPTLRLLTGVTPWQAVAAQIEWLDATERTRCQQVVDRLTSRQREVLRAFAAGHNPQEVAELLSVTVKAVDLHKTVILSECRNAWGIPESTRLTYHFLRDKFRHFFRLEP